MLTKLLTDIGNDLKYYTRYTEWPKKRDRTNILFNGTNKLT